jgi:hypothetical protein
MCIRDAQQREICVRLLNDTIVTPIEITTHSIHSLLLCFIHVFICFFVCIQPAVLGGGGVGKYVIGVFQRTARFRIFMRRYFVVTVTVGGLIKTEEICGYIFYS